MEELEVSKESYDFVSMLEFTEKDLVIQNNDKFDWDLVPVTQDWGSQIVANKLRISEWMKDRITTAEEFNRRLKVKTLTPEELYLNPGWFCCWRIYYRLEYDYKKKDLCYLSKRDKFGKNIQERVSRR